MSSIEADFREKGVAIVDFKGKELAKVYRGLSNIGYPVIPFTYDEDLEDAKSVDPRIVIFNAIGEFPVPVELFPNKPIITISHNEDRRADAKLLDAGSEIVIPAPVSVSLLDAYIRSTINREERPRNILPPLKLTDDITIERSAGRMMRGEERIKASLRVVEFLEYAGATRKFTNADISHWLEEKGYASGQQNIYMLIQSSRLAIDKEGEPTHIAKVKRSKYKFLPNPLPKD